jgi:hypothetical protein
MTTPLPSDNTAYGLSVRRTDELLARVLVLEEYAESSNTAITELEARVLALETTTPDEVPGPITNLTFSDTTSTNVTANWDLPSSGGDHSKTYIVCKLEDAEPTDPSTAPDSIEITDSTTITYLLQTLEPDTEYFVFIYAYGPGGFSSALQNSFTTSAGSGGSGDPPSQIETTTFGTIRDTSIELDFTSPSSLGGGWDGTFAHIKTENVAPTDPGSGYDFDIASTVFTVTFEGLTPSTQYWIFLYAYGPEGFSAVKTDSVSTESQPDALTSFQITNRSASDVSFSWDSINLNVLIFVRTSDSTPPDPVNDFPDLRQTNSAVTVGTVSNLSNTTTYYYWAYAQSDVATSAASTGTFSTKTATPANPFNLSLQYIDSGSLTLNWELDTDLGSLPTSQRIFKLYPTDPVPDETSTGYDEKDLTARYTGFSGLTAATQYKFYVLTVITASGTSSMSVSQIASISHTPPVAPTIEYCWQTDNGYNPQDNTWTLSGEEPAKGREPECWETATLNSACVWVYEGTQPENPTGGTGSAPGDYTFNNDTCQWDPPPDTTIPSE